MALSEIVQREMARAQLRLGRLARDISTTCNHLSSVVELSELRQLLGEQLPYLGLNEYFIVLYLSSEPRRAGLLAARTQDNEHIPVRDVQFDAQAPLPRALLPQLVGGKAFVLLPLVHKMELFGHALFGLEIERAFAYEQIANAIGAGIHAARLTERAHTLASGHQKNARNSAVLLSDTSNDDEDTDVLEFTLR